MKRGVHPDYGPVCFRDRSAGALLVTQSTLVSRADLSTGEMDGRTLPVVDVDVTSDSHPFWTGKTRPLDSDGRVEAFRRRGTTGARR